MNPSSTCTDPLTAQPGAPAHPPAAALGWWTGSHADPWDALPAALADITRPVIVLDDVGSLRVARDGTTQLGGMSPAPDALPVIGYTAPLHPRLLGDPGFQGDYGLRLPYMTGAMANGIASTRLVRAVCEAGMLGSFGAAGLPLPAIEQALADLQQALGDKVFCVNLIHSPNEKGKEDATVDLFLDRKLRLVEASAYLALTPAVVRYRIHGIHTDPSGNIVTPNRIIAKASRVEVATRWFSPPPEKILRQLLDQGVITSSQAELARRIPMARDLTVEADSGGHTDNRPAISLLPTMIALRDRLQAEHGYAEPLRVGAAGGIATPASAAAAFAMGAAYVVTGTVNQACVESGSSDLVRSMLGAAEQADVAMAPAVDMFEMGVKLQVLKRGTLFAMRGNKLYECYRNYPSLEAIPATERAGLEKTIFRAPLTEIWENTRAYFQERDPEQITRAAQDPKHRMALTFRWYLGLSSRWANAGEASRQADYQIWCGPAMGAFNEWTRDSFLDQPHRRSVVTVGLNLMYGAAVMTRMHTLRSQGVDIPPHAATLRPVERATIENQLK